jgi:hypothetical protein
MGRTIIRAYLNLQNVLPSLATSKLGATRAAGMAMDVALRVRRHGRLTIDELSRYAALAAVSGSDLRLVTIPALNAAGVVEVLTNEFGDTVGIEEQVGVARPVMEQTAAVWDWLGPSALERCAIASSDLLAFTPLGLTAHKDVLEQQGFLPSLHDEAFQILRAVGMLRSSPSAALGEPVLYSPYVWGTEAVGIAEFMQRLPANEREVLSSLSRTVAERPGASVDGLVPNARTVEAARKVGLIATTRVLTTGGSEHAFAFSPALDSQLGTGDGDVVHARKLFVAHILYGYRYGHAGTGRIAEPLVLVNALINRGRVGPATAIRTDYPLLEARGIVRVREDTAGMAFLELVQEDVAKDALELLRQALGDDAAGHDAHGRLDALWVPGVFRGPEEDRAHLPEIAGAEAEVFSSTVEELRKATARRIRGEDL